MLIDKKRQVIALKIIAVPAKRRKKKYSSSRKGESAAAVILYWNIDVSKYYFEKSENTNCNFCEKTAVYA